jgi:hypothetical protein
MTGIETGSLFLIISSITSITVLTILLPIVGAKKMYYTYSTIKRGKTTDTRYPQKPNYENLC